tara:strand:- start:6195 stop:7484 length:1290 start_codon:yes stop_codon:yes gene_type:complete
MPQANITYDTRYNRDLASRIVQMEDDALFQNKHQYFPNPMGYRMSSFHNAQGISNTPNIGRDYSHGGDTSGGVMSGGVKAGKYILNGNSPAYPPMNMRAGLAVSSGGAHTGLHGRSEMAGVDGAVGGNFWKDFSKGFTDTINTVGKVADTAASVLPIATKAASLVGLGRGAPGKGHVGRAKGMRGGNFLKGLAGLAKKIAPIALPLLMGLGRKASMADKKKAIADAIVGGNFWDGFKKGFGDVMGLASKVAPIALPLMTGLGKKQYGGSFNFGKFLEKQAKAVAPELLDMGKKAAMKKGKEMLGLGKATDMKSLVPPMRKMPGSGKDACGRSSGTREFGAPCGGNILDDAIEMTKPLVRKGKKALKEAVIENAPKATKALKKAADKAITKAVGGGRSARAAIVKKVMAEKGMKMIEASKYVKEHGLYKK